MASLVGAFAASHGPLIVREWERVPDEHKKRMSDAYQELDRMPKIVPLLVNSIEPPMPSLKRCYEWGTLLRKAIESYSEPLRVAILATGGLSHSIGEKTMGAIHEDFDRQTIRQFGLSDRSLIEFLDRGLPTRGNGSEEVRNWLVAHGAAGGRGFELVDYLPVPTVIVGCGFAAWRVTPA